MPKFKFAMPTKEELTDNSYEVKPVKWKWDWGAYLPFCPYCDEPAYDDEWCFNCHKKYKMVEGEFKDVIVTDGEWSAVSTPGKSLFIYHKGQTIAHASCTKQFTEEELLQQLKRFSEVKKGDEKQIPQ